MTSALHLRLLSVDPLCASFSATCLTFSLPLPLLLQTFRIFRLRCLWEGSRKTTTQVPVTFQGWSASSCQSLPIFCYMRMDLRTSNHRWKCCPTSKMESCHYFKELITSLTWCIILFKRLHLMLAHWFTELKKENAGELKELRKRGLLCADLLKMLMLLWPDKVKTSFGFSAEEEFHFGLG